MNKALAQFTLEDGTEVLFEVPEPSDANAIEEVGIDAGLRVYEATQTFEQAIAKVQPVANAIISRFKTGLTTPASEVEIKFGLVLTADAGAIFTSVGGAVNFEITLKWQKQD